MAFLLINLLRNKNVISKNIFSKIFEKYNFKSLQKIRENIGNFINTYLLILLIINVVMIVFYVCLNIYVNIDLSNNLDKYIYVYSKFKKSSVLLLGCYKNNFINKIIIRVKRFLKR